MPCGPATDPQTAPAPAPKKSCWRRTCGCCLGAFAAPALILLGLLIWLSLGPAPEPADCLPADAPLRAVIRDPAGLFQSVLADERWRPLRESLAEGGRVPEPGQVRWLGFLLKRAAGSELAVAGDGHDPVVLAMRPGILFRAVERLTRVKVKAGADGVRRGPDGKVFYGFIGKTLIVAGRRQAVAEVLERGPEILGRRPSAAPPRDARVELRFDATLPGAGSDPGALAFALDLPCPARCSGWLRADREILRLTGQAEFEPTGASPGALPPPLPSAGPASARLVPAEALGYWVWQAPPGTGRWESVGRLRFMAGALGGEGSDLGLLFAELSKAGVDPEKVLGPRLAGERALAAVSQPGPGGAPLLPALSFMAECREPKGTWPLARKALEVYYQVPVFDEPPVVGGKPPDPYLLRRGHRGVEIVEVVYNCYPLGSGFRPACAMAGKFLVGSTSRAELERMIDRAAAGASGTLAGSERIAPRAGRAPPAELLVLAPQGKGRELADLALAIGHALSKPGAGPGPDEERRAAAAAALLSKLELLRAEWLAGEKGRLRLELEGRIGR